MFGTDHFQEAILSKGLYLFARLRGPRVLAEHKARNLWNFLSLHPDEVISLRARIFFGSVKIYPALRAHRGQRGRLPPLNQVIVISLLNTPCARVGRMSVMCGRPPIYDLFMFALGAQHAKGVSLCLSPGPAGSLSVREKKSAKKKKWKDSGANHLFLTSLRGWRQVSLYHTHTCTHTQISMLLTAEVAMLYIGGGTAVCIMQGHFSGRAAWSSWHQQHFPLKPRHHERHLPSLAHLPGCTAIKCACIMDGNFPPPRLP